MGELTLTRVEKRRLHQRMTVLERHGVLPPEEPSETQESSFERHTPHVRTLLSASCQKGNHQHCYALGCRCSVCHAQDCQ